MGVSITCYFKQLQDYKAGNKTIFECMDGLVV